LTSVTIPSSVTILRGSAFAECTNLTEVYFKGNAPEAWWPDELLSVFSGDDSAIVYYLPGTTGWGATFADRPAVLWNPQALTTDSDFGVRAGQFGFTITGTPGITVVVESTPD
ncbi:MAG TPA: hypothetical protein VM680_18385, partial [Verrucomicrobiae bacterium]|nr:hypothetical protein [Verrucomicrobiae bacterium]